MKLNLDVVESLIVKFIKNTVQKSGFENGIIGVSGGIDSAVVLTLAVKALAPAHVYGLLMPYRTSSPDSAADAKDLCQKLQVGHEIIDITSPIDAYFDKYPTGENTLIGNKCARERMSVLYDFSVRKKALVIGAANKSELLVGYSTLYGDSAAAFFPIGDLYKTQVFALAKRLSIPETIINKKPTADLWPGQTDEVEMGINYPELDEILFQLVDLKKKPAEMERMGFNRDKVEKVREMIIKSQFKRTMPPILKISSRTIGLDFRYLRDWHK